MAYRGKTSSLIDGDRGSSALTMLMSFSNKVNSEIVANLAKRWTVVCASLDYGCLCWVMTAVGSFVAIPRWRAYVDGDLTVMLVLAALASASGIALIVPSTLRFLYHYRTTKLKRDITLMYARRAALHLTTTALYAAATAFIFIESEPWEQVGMPGAVIVSGALFGINSLAHLAFAYVWVATCRAARGRHDRRPGGAAGGGAGRMTSIEEVAQDAEEDGEHRAGDDDARARTSTCAKASTSLPDELLEQVKRNNSSEVRPEAFEQRYSVQVLRSSSAGAGAAGGGPAAGAAAGAAGAGKRRLSLMQEAAGDGDAGGEEKPREYDVFLSYKHANMADALAIAKALEKGGFSVWLDTMIEPGENWREQVAVSLERSRVLVFLATDMAVASQFCQEEIFYAKEMKKPLLPLTLDAFCFDELKLHKQLNATLAPIQFIDFRNEEEGQAVLMLRLQRVLRRRSSQPQAAMLPSI